MDLPFILPAGLTWSSLLALVVVLAASGIMSGLSGFGFSAIGAICLSFLPPQLGIPLLMTLSTANQLLAIGQLKADMKPVSQWWPNGPTPYLIGGVIGAPIGLWLLKTLPVPTFMLWFGGFLMSYAAYSLLKPNTVILSKQYGPIASIAVGGIGGAVGGLTAFPGAALVIWAGLSNMAKGETRAVVQPYILCTQLFSLTLLAIFAPSSFSSDFWILLLVLLPVVLPCTYLGTILYRRLSDMNFRRVAFLLLGSSGVGIFVKGSQSLKLFSFAV